MNLFSHQNNVAVYIKLLMNIHSQKIYRKRVIYLNSYLFFYEEYHNQLIYYVYKDVSELLITANNFIVNKTFLTKYIGVKTHTLATFLL